MAESKLICILCMEDDPGLARLFQRRLEREGYVVDLARDGQEGLDMCAQMSYDVVAVDQAMPVYDGLEVIRRMASQGPLPPTIMVTGAGDERTAVEAMKLGARDYIVKDVDGGYLELLPTVIERALEHQRLAAQAQRAEEALRAERHLLRTLTDNLPDPVNVKDAEGRYVLANPAQARLLGLESPQEMVGKTPFDFYPEELARRYYHAADQQVLTSAEPLISREEMVIDADGQDRWFLNSKVPLRDAVGSVVGLVSTSREITERKRFDEERERLIVDLREALASVRTLRGMLPICAACKKIRDDQGYWQAVERYISEHSEAEFSHGLCPDCMKKLYPEFYEEDESVASGSNGL